MEKNQSILVVDQPGEVLATVRDDSAYIQALNEAWKAKLLDGRTLERNERGYMVHPDIHQLPEGITPRDFFAACGIELHTSTAENEMGLDAYEAMTANGSGCRAWTPAAPEAPGWSLVAIFDTEDGPTAWWMRGMDQPAQSEVLGSTCIDGGKCHHACTERCFRRECCHPLSASGMTLMDFRYPDCLPSMQAAPAAEIVTHNPYTGEPRDARDIASDPAGKLIVAPGPMFAAKKAEPLPLLVRDLARELCITAVEACVALKPLGNYSVNSAVTAEMAAKLRECFPEPAPAAVAVLDAEKLLRAEAARLKRLYCIRGSWYGFKAEKLAHLEHLRVADALAATPASAATDMKWQELFWAVARALNCLPSTFVDANAHVYLQAEKYAAIAAKAQAAAAGEDEARNAAV